MAKDGTQRGGARVGAGRKRKPLADKISEGRTATIIDLPAPADMVGVETPLVKEYMTARQKDGKDMCAADVFKTTWAWLKERKCDALVSQQLVEQYAMAVGRWVQCEEALSEYGFLAKHPTTGNAIASPFVSMSMQYMKQANQLWYHCHDVAGFDAHDSQSHDCRHWRQ